METSFRHPGTHAFAGSPEISGLVAQGQDVARGILALVLEDLADLARAKGPHSCGPLAAARQEAALKRLAEAIRILERLERLQGNDTSKGRPGGPHAPGTLHEALAHRPDALGVLRQIERLGESGVLERCRQIRWPSGFRCPNCDGRAGTWIRRSRAYRCRSCGRFAALFARSLPGRSHLPLLTWVLAVLATAVHEDLVPARFAGWVSINRHSTIRHLVRKVAPLGASIRAANERLTLTGILEVLLGQHVDHQTPPSGGR